MEHHPSATGETRAHHADRGASLVEYALILALIVVVSVGAMAFFGGSLSGNIDRSNTSIMDVVR
jgi:Flp pilus assembly pilin Flp